MSSFPEIIFSDTRECSQISYLCKFAQTLERQEDVSRMVLTIIQKTHRLDSEQRDLFASSFKHALERYRSSFPIINFVRSGKVDHQLYVISPYLKENMTTITSKIVPYIGERIFAITDCVLGVLPLLMDRAHERINFLSSSRGLGAAGPGAGGRQELAPNAAAPVPSEQAVLGRLSEGGEEETLASAIEALVFYYKMKGDYSRYKIETITTQEELCSANAKDGSGAGSGAGDGVNDKADVQGAAQEERENRRRLKEELVQAGKKSYGEGFEIGNSKLGLANYGVLGIALNYSVFIYEIEGKKSEAIEFMEGIYEKGMKLLLDVKDDDEYEKLHVILLLARDNLDSWKNEGKKSEEEKKAKKEEEKEEEKEKGGKEEE